MSEEENYEYFQVLDKIFENYFPHEILESEEQLDEVMGAIKKVVSAIKDKVKNYGGPDGDSSITALHQRKAKLIHHLNKIADSNYDKRMSFLDQEHARARKAFDSGDHKTAFKILKDAKRNLKNIGEELEENYEDDKFISFEEYEALSEEEKAEYEIIQLDEISTKTLARAAHAASDPETFGKYHDPQKFADYAKKTKSAKAAANVQRAASGMGHFAKPNRSFGYDPLKDAKTTRVTKSGTMNKQDAAAKKNEIKNRLGTHTKAKLPEEYDYELDESVASDTLKAGSRSVADPKSKIEAITSVIGAMHAMRKDDLTKWYTQAMDLIGKEADSLPSGANADSNSSSIDTKLGKGPKTRDPMPKLSVKEDVEEMFDGQDLSEEFKDRATTLFEAAVNAKIIVELAKLEEQYEERLHEEVAEISEALEKKLDTYLDYVTETWLKENEVAIESTLRNEITEEFIDGLRGLFAEHYIEVPENKIDVIEELAAKVEALETKLDESITENVQLREALTVSEMTDILREMAEDLTLNESEKFAALAEGIEFDGDLDTYRKKLAYVKESYFNKKTVQRVSNIEEETFEAPESDRVVSADPEISRYAQAISRTVKR